MGRTNIVIDDELVAKVMKLYDLPTKRAAVQFALERLVGKKRYTPRDMLDLRGIGWDGDLDAMRASRNFDE
ncbi:MAG TPA: type II toxin-antitoxin system VapB family antitoxin [Actinomycetota bacterium]|nr:type II toxin-antitoxin system VapB family antitoxin [Actinomycetota bacterium]